MERKYKILIVDDDVDLASNLQDVLEVEGYSTTVAYDGKTALTLCRERLFHLAIVDIKLPDMQGVVLVGELTDISPGLEYVIITAYASLDSAIEAVSWKSIVAYETKPLNMDRFVALITRWSAGKRVEEELQRERQKAQRYLDFAGVTILVIDSDQRVSLINKKGCQILGCEEKEVIGKNWFDTFIPERIRDEVSTVFEKLMAGEVESVEYFENPVLTRSGEERVIAWHNTILHDEDGGITAILSSGEDITERKQVEERLARELAATSAVVNDMLRGEVDDAETEKKVLDACLTATDSVYGMIGVINEQGKYDTTTYSSQTLQDCAFPEALAWEISRGMTIRGIWGWPMLHGEPLICNDLESHTDRVGFPKGHVLLSSFLGVPLKREGKVVGMIAVANKPGGYTVEDRNTLIRLASAITVSRQHRLAIVAANRKTAELEQLVAERTKQLQKDITERKQAEEALREGEEKLRRMFESVTDGITVTDLKAIITEVNERVLEMHGFGSRDDIIGKNAFQLIANHDHEKAMDNMQKTLEQGTITSIEYTLLKADGSEFPSELSASVLKDVSGKPIGFISITRDITERKRIEAEKSELEHQAQLTSRLAAVGEMASGVAHEINNPLTTVIGFAHLLMQKDISEDIKSDVENITDGAQRIAGIVDRLLTFTRPQERERKYININDVIKATLAMRAYEMETSNIKATTQLDPDLPLIMADGTLLQQVFLNIIINADTEMRLAHGRGNLFIKTETIGDSIRISFKDDGPGIAKENLEKIFDPFFTTRKVGEGTGLGLSICHGIITQYNGQIYAKSRLGRGATFVLELPVVTKAQQLEMAELPAEESRDVTGAKILIIDDEPRILRLMSILLRGEGYEIETLDNASDALDRLKNKTYDLILLDIKLRGMSGIELYQHTKKIAESIAKSMVFITGDVEGAITRDFLSKTKAQYIIKPFDPEKLKKDIKRILAEKIQRLKV